MPSNPHDAYLETRILSAEPMELIRLLYQAAISEIRDARDHLRRKDIRARSKSISKAHDILSELTISLDRKRGGQYAVNLARLYDYMMGRLTEANFAQIDQPLAETLGLLTTLQEGWEGIRQEIKPAAQSGSAWAQPATREPASTSQAWSF